MRWRDVCRSGIFHVVGNFFLTADLPAHWHCHGRTRIVAARCTDLKLVCLGYQASCNVIVDLVMRYDRAGIRIFNCRMNT